MTILRNTTGAKFKEIKVPKYHMVLISNYHTNIVETKYKEIRISKYHKFDLNYLRVGIIKFYLLLFQKFTEIP